MSLEESNASRAYVGVNIISLKSKRNIYIKKLNKFLSTNELVYCVSKIAMVKSHL